MYYKALSCDFYRMLNADHAITLLLAILLGLKYVFFDVDIDTEFQKCLHASEESQTVIGNAESNTLDNTSPGKRNVH